MEVLSEFVNKKKDENHNLITKCLKNFHFFAELSRAFDDTIDTRIGKY